MTQEEQELYDQEVQRLVGSGFSQTEAEQKAMALVNSRRASAAAQTDETKPYEWIDQFPPGFRPQPRGLRGTGGARGGMFGGRGLVNADLQLERNADGTIKQMYGPDDVQGILRSLPYAQRRQIATIMKGLGIYGTSAPSANIDQLVDFNAFARVLYTANQEGITWDRSLDLIASRINELPLGTRSKTYQSSSIADIKRAIQDQARSLLGRELGATEIAPLAQQVAQQEITTARMADRPGATQQPTATTTIIERQLGKQSQPEADAYKAAQFIQKILGGG